MSNIREEVVHTALNRAFALTDANIHNDIHKHFEFQKQTLLADKSLTEDEKTEAIKQISKTYDETKVQYNSGTKRICENCNQECLATLFCEYCVRNYLKANFSNWTSGNDNIDDLIQKCQSETLM
ncbi:kinase-like domain-containing protein [Rhizophagus irregularis DAOM 181602=DAOM 197198]|nr:kinase-like domain-containing protein [Rhizophagus irregularis DAOM 181602=DAOM 197198]